MTYPLIFESQKNEKSNYFVQNAGNTRNVYRHNNNMKTCFSRWENEMERLLFLAQEKPQSLGDLLLLKRDKYVENIKTACSANAADVEWSKQEPFGWIREYVRIYSNLLNSAYHCCLLYAFHLRRHAKSCLFY